MEWFFESWEHEIFEKILRGDPCPTKMEWVLDDRGNLQAIEVEEVEDGS